MQLWFDPEADAQLGKLQDTPQLSELWERVNNVLDGIEDNPTDSQYRRRRYQTPPIWGVPVHGSGKDWLILWSETEGGLLIHYIGPEPT